MHADIHLTLHHLDSAERARTAAGTSPVTSSPPLAPATPLRVRLGWRLVEFGLTLALPRARRVTAARAARTAHAAMA
ncbi:hypothetical protein ACFY8W_30370 [Streptomyces sp. NPDC012637]|uniref:hypothetical protein n=1 Tax=Streptomyces sp. NPDC012637 TaxID=3364842 RepID=UPI0036E1A9AA